MSVNAWESIPKEVQRRIASAYPFADMGSRALTEIVTVVPGVSYAGEEPVVPAYRGPVIDGDRTFEPQELS